MITGEHNQKIKYIRSLSKRKFREENGCFYIEGHRAVLEGIMSQSQPEILVASESYINSDSFNELKQICFAYNIDAKLVLLPVSDKVFESISDTLSPQGLGGVFKINKVELSSLFEKSNIILLENIQDPGNMGTIIRTADAAGFDAIICGKGSVDIYNSKVLRSTVGSVFHLPVLLIDDIALNAANLLKKAGFKLYCAHPRGDNSCFDLTFEGKSVIVIGNEANGLTEDMLSLCDIQVTIPMPGKSESLNASVAAALLMYEVVRKRSVKK